MTDFPTRFVRAAIRKALVDAGSHGGERDIRYRYRNGRIFDIREQDDGRFFMSEMIPNGRFAREDATGRMQFWDVPEAAEAAGDPNGFEQRIRDLGLDPVDTVMHGDGYGRFSRYLSDINMVVDEIRTAILGNVRYDSCDHAMAKDPIVLARLALQDQVATEWFRTYDARAHQEAVQANHGLFKGLRSMMGPLDKDRQLAILSYLNSPSTERWDAIYSTQVDGFRTIWWAWTEVDPTAPRSKPMDGDWPRIPDPEMLKQALRHASGMEAEDTSEPNAFSR